MSAIIFSDTLPLPPEGGFQAQGLARLLRRSFAGEDLRGYAQTLIGQASRSDDAYLLLELSLALLLSFQREAALKVLDQAIKIRPIYQLQRSSKARLRVLMIKTPGDLMANTPLECILENQPVDLDVVYVTRQHLLPDTLPEHDLVFVAIAEAEAHVPLLTELDRQLQDHPRPVLNRPAAIPALARDHASKLLSSIPNLYMPRVDACDRQDLALRRRQDAHPLPWIIRPQGSHAGQGLARIDSQQGLDDYLETHQGNRFFVAPYIDYADQDGLFRKYRIVMTDGQAWPCHMGISGHWMVHYPYPEMQQHPDRRVEEAAFMRGFREGFDQRHGSAMRAMQRCLGLDYLGFDCAEMPDGRLLVFELSNALVIHDMDRPDLFPYKHRNMQEVFAGVATMLLRHAIHPTT